jgi:hypothetical protein
MVEEPLKPVLKLEVLALPAQVCHAVGMDNEESRKAKKLLEQAEDRERMARILKRHQAPAKKETLREEEKVNQPLRKSAEKLLSIDRLLL